MNFPNILRFIAIIFLLIGIPKGLPYGYYTLLRVMMTGVFVWFCYISSEKIGNAPWAITFGLLTIIYNPIYPLHLGKDIWIGVNVLTIVIIVVSIFKLRGKMILLKTKEGDKN